jgi:hypothetical protein
LEPASVKIARICGSRQTLLLPGYVSLYLAVTCHHSLPRYSDERTSADAP